MTSCDQIITVGRIYDRPDLGDYRVLVDRVWPRGLAETGAALDEWCCDIAPSASLRRWYSHHPERFAAFRDRYLAELDDPANARALAHLRRLARDRLTLLTAMRDLAVSPACVLAERLTWGRARDHPTLTHIRLDDEVRPARWQRR
ncbi:MAG TPA: DUF488 family protein [Jatrophihabitantaceae bacterium]|jgi:uncharacterized protein YeaO (DUF488 family)